MAGSAIAVVAAFSKTIMDFWNVFLSASITSGMISLISFLVLACNNSPTSETRLERVLTSSIILI